MANKPRNLKVKKVEKSVSSLSLKPRFNKQGKAVRRKAGKEVIGRVVSAKMAKTVVVVVNRLFRHPLYKKAIRRTKRFLVHNEGLILNVGDRVKIKEVRPISKNKHFVVKEKLL